MFSRRLLYAVLSLATLPVAGIDPAPVLATDQPVGVAEFGCGIIVMRYGDLFVAGFGPNACPRPQGPWSLLANVFVSAGRGPGLVVGLNQNGQVLAANGDWFQLAIDYNYCSGIAANYQGNVFEVTGFGVPGEEFVAFGGGSPGGGYEYAVTTRGSVFRWAGCAGWEYLGPMNAPTQTTRSSWGMVKLLYR